MCGPFVAGCIRREMEREIAVEERYFVASDGQEPVRIYFDRESAYASQAAYIDSFDEHGMPVQRYTLDD